MRYLVRQPYWRHRLIKWANAVRYKPYEWGSTDCAALGRAALYVQFGEDVLRHMPWWTTIDTARAIWAPLECNGGINSVFAEIGAQHLEKRVEGVRYPMGAILLLARDPEEIEFPAFGVAVDPIVVQSNTRQGVQWTMDYEVEGAWLFECVEMRDG